MTQDEILELEAYCIEKGISKKEGLKQYNVTDWNYYSSKRKLGLSKPPVQSSFTSKDTGSFIPIIFQNEAVGANKSKSRSRRETELARGNVLTIELRTSIGTELRIQGQMNISMLREILNSSGGQKDV